MAQSIQGSIKQLAAVFCGGLVLSTGGILLSHSHTHAQTTATTAAPNGVGRSTCPFLNQARDQDTGSTTATYNPATKVLNIQVNRSVPPMFWGIAESRTQARADKILANCPDIAMVEVNFQSGQKLTRRRAN
jgi:hypothetical protein